MGPLKPSEFLLPGNWTQAQISSHLASLAWRDGIRHGTRGSSGYQLCRQRSEGSCEACRRAERVYIARYLLTSTAPLRHGTGGNSGYQRCRRRPEGACGECREANRATLATWRARRKGQGRRSTDV